MHTVACAALFFATPGAEELVEDVGHVLLDGHTFHDAGHESADHCCSGVFHFCSCHATAAATPLPFYVGATRSVFAVSVALPDPIAVGAASDAHRLEMLRPPAA